MEKATYYAKKTYKNNIFIGCVRDPEMVVNDFRKHIYRFIPVSYTCNDTRIFITFCDNNSMIFYELPINYKF